MTSRSILTLVGVALTAWFATVAILWQWSSVVATRERDATNLRRIMSQRVDQHDAHLTGVSALTTSSSTPLLAMRVAMLAG